MGRSPGYGRPFVHSIPADTAARQALRLVVLRTTVELDLVLAVYTFALIDDAVVLESHTPPALR